MSASAIGRIQVFNATAEDVRRTPRESGKDNEEISPVASARKPGTSSRHRSPPVTIDLRPDPPSQSGDEAAYEARRAANRGSWSKKGWRPRRRGAPEGDPEPQWAYRSNSDTPYRRRTSDETYQAIEDVDAPARHRGGIFDRRI